MNFRLQQFLAAENITQAQFADLIGVARASVSHIIAGRNKPGFDFIQSMSRAFPDLNLEWLIHGKGRMYKEGRREPAPLQQSTEGQLFAAAQEEAPALPPAADPVPETPALPDSPAPAFPPINQTEPAENKQTYADPPKVKVQTSGRRITRIVVFYDDNTYQELREA